MKQLKPKIEESHQWLEALYIAVVISIIGAGFVGLSVAYALVSGGLASEVVLVDTNREKAEDCRPGFPPERTVS